MAINRDKVLKEAEKLVQKGKIEQAIQEYEKILKANPNDANTINRIGDLYGRVGEVDKAVELYERIAEHFTRDGFIPKAIAILKKINRLAPQRLDVFERLAELYIQQGLMVEAKSQYQILAEWYAKNGDLEKAAGAHQRLIQLDPSNHLAHLRLADILMQQGQTEQALAVYDRLGRLLLERGRLDEAERLYRHALEQDPPSGSFLTPFCEALIEAGRAPVAREFLAAALQRSPEDDSLQVLQIRVLLTFGEARQAVSHARQLLEKAPDSHDIRMLVGQALLKAGEAVEARDMLLPTARSLTDRGNHVAAQQMVQGLLKAMPQDLEVLRVAVTAFASSGETEMIFTLRAALADSLYRSRQMSEAKLLYGQLLQEDPENQMFKRRLAELGGAEEGEADLPSVGAPVPEMQTPPPRRQVDSARPASAAPPASPFDPSERLAEAAVFSKYGLVDKAVNHLREILDAIPGHREARERLVMLLVEQGETSRAVEVARPLVATYRAAGDLEAERTLRGMLPQIGEDAAAAVPEPAKDLREVIAADEDDVIVIEFEDEGVELVAEVPLAGFPTPGPEPEDLPSPELRFEEPASPADEEITDSSIRPPSAREDEASFEPTFAVSLEEPESSQGTVEDWERELREAARTMPERSADGGALSELDALERSLLGGGGTPVPERLSPPPPTAAYEGGVSPSRDEEAAAAAPQPLEDEGTAAQPVVFDFEGLSVSAPGHGSPESLHAGTGSAQLSSVDELLDLSDSLGGPSLDDLDRIDFFIQQQLLDDALRELQRLEREFPDDPEIAQRRVTLKSKGVLLESVAPEAAAEASEDLFADEEDFFDLAKELEEELAEEEALVDEATGRGKDEALLEEVFREFQKGVAEQLSEEDSDTHFNLGIAYKEMGLLPEAIREFQISSRDPEFFVESCSMIGVCYLEQGMADRAAEWYQKALVAPDLSSASRIALRYDLAGSLELAGELVQAYDLFAEIHAADPSFRDVADRMVSLDQQRQAN